MFTGVLVLEKHFTAFGFGVSAKLPGVWGSVEEKCIRWSMSTPKPKATFYKEFPHVYFLTRCQVWRGTQEAQTGRF